LTVRQCLLRSYKKVLHDLSKPLACFVMAMGACNLVERQRLGSAVLLVGANLDGWQLVALVLPGSALESGRSPFGQFAPTPVLRRERAIDGGPDPSRERRLALTTFWVSAAQPRFPVIDGDRPASAKRADINPAHWLGLHSRS
jgi:hypothetical protein